MIDTNIIYGGHILENEDIHLMNNVISSPQRILLPLTGKEFERFAISVAGWIAQSHGSTLVLLQGNLQESYDLIKTLERFQLKFEMKNTRIKDITKAIIKEVKTGYDLVVLPIPRRKGILEKVLHYNDLENIPSIIDCNVLQVFPSIEPLPSDNNMKISLSTISIFLTKDIIPYNLTSSIQGLITSDDMEIKINYIAEVPEITPLGGIIDHEVIHQERRVFEEFLDLCSTQFNCKTFAKFILAHNAADLKDNRLKLAKELGATHTINSGSKNLVSEVEKITGSTVDFAFDCTGVIPVIEQIAETVGMLGTLVLIGGAPANARFSLDHLQTLWGKRILGVLGGGGRSRQLIPALIELYQQGRFPFDRLVKFYEMKEIEDALADSKSGKVIKPILRMPK